MPCSSGRRNTYVTHAQAFEPMSGIRSGMSANAPGEVRRLKTLEKPIWRNTTIIRGDVVEAVRAIKEAKPGKTIMTDGSSQLVHTLLAHDLVDEIHMLLYPLALGGGKRLFPEARSLGSP